MVGETDKSFHLKNSKLRNFEKKHGCHGKIKSDEHWHVIPNCVQMNFTKNHSLWSPLPPPRKNRVKKRFIHDSEQPPSWKSILDFLNFPKLHESTKTGPEQSN